VSIHDNAEELIDMLIEGQLDPKELAKGTKDEEHEHDMPPKKARKTAKQHLTRVDPHYYSKVEKCLGEDEGPCPGCHTPMTGRRLELEQLGWRQIGWGWENTEWINPVESYQVRDHIIDNIPEDEWNYIKAATHARSAADVNLPEPKYKKASEYVPEPPKANIMPGGSAGGPIGDTTTIGFAAGGD
jgi:hypothetical protein